MISREKDDLLDTAGLTLETLTLASTRAGHKTVRLVAMLRKKIQRLSRWSSGLRR